MRYFLDNSINTINPAGTIQDFAEGLMNPGASTAQHIIKMTDGSIERLPIVLSYVLEDPGACVDEIFTFFARGPRELSEQVSKHLDATLGYVRSSEEIQSDRTMMNEVTIMAKHLDDFTKEMARSRPWDRLYNGPVPVTRIWRTEKDQVIGEPEDRKVASNLMPNRLSSLVIAEDENRPDSSKVMFSVSEGRYRPDGAAEVREDFLVDIAKMFEQAISRDTRLRRDSRCSIDEGIYVLWKLLEKATPLLLSICHLTDSMREAGILKDPKLLFGAIEKIEKILPLNPENNPNALYTIGEWS